MTKYLVTCYYCRMPLYFFHGEDTYRKREKLNLWKREFVKKHGEHNLEVIEGSRATAAELFSNIHAVPFLGDKRLIIVENFLRDGAVSERDAFGGMIANVPESSVAIISEDTNPDKRTTLYKKLAKHAEVVAFDVLQGSELHRFIEREVAKNGGTIDPDAIELLTELRGRDLHALTHEIEKLAAFSDTRSISVSDVELLTDTTLATSIFRFTDALGAKRIAQAANTLHHLIDTGEDPYHILYMMMRQFRILSCVKDLAAQGLGKAAIVAKLKEHPFVVSNTLAQVGHFSWDQIKRAYTLLIDLDTRLKSGGIKVLVGDKRDFALALDRLVLELCR